MRPSSRGGVPVFKRPSVKPSAFKRARKPHGRGFADAAGRHLFFADVNEAAQKSAGGQNHRAAEISRPSAIDPANAAVGDEEIVGFAFEHLQIRRFRIATCIAAA